MELEFIQLLIIVIIIIVFGTIITIFNFRKKPKTVVDKEQTTWQTIENLNNDKKELIEKKKEISYKYIAKNITDQDYSEKTKYLNSEIKKVDAKIELEFSKISEIKKDNNPEDELRFKNIKITGELNETELENRNLKEKVAELESFIKTLSKTNNLEPTSDDVTKAKYYSIIINKYKNIINDNERKTISEMKDSVKSSDLTIKNIASKFTPIGYDFDKDYIPTLRKIYNYLKSEIDVVTSDLKITYTLSFSKIITEKIADQHSMAILFCSIMHNLEDKNAKIEMVMLENENIHALVSTKYKNTNYIFDLIQKTPFDMFKNQDEKKVYEEYTFNNNKISQRIYAYNQYNYIDFDKS